jgi:hypothetical protein
LFFFFFFFFLFLSFFFFLSRSEKHGKQRPDPMVWAIYRFDLAHVAAEKSNGTEKPNAEKPWIPQQRCV